MNYVIMNPLPATNWRRIIGIIPTGLRVAISNHLAFRAQVVLWMLFDPMLVVAFPLIWITIARDQGGAVAGWSVGAIALYYAFYIIAQQTIITHPMVAVSEDIERGTMANHLIRPTPFLMAVMIDEVAYHVVKAIIIIVPLAVVFYFARDYLTTINWAAVLVSLPLFGLGFFIQFLASYFFGLLTFWTEHPLGLHSLFWVLSGAASGMYAPLEFFPSWLQSILHLLPFVGVLPFPINVALGNIHWFDRAFFVGINHQIIWLAILAVAVAWCWRRGTRRYVNIGQ